MYKVQGAAGIAYILMAHSFHKAAFQCMTQRVHFHGSPSARQWFGFPFVKFSEGHGVWVARST